MEIQPTRIKYRAPIRLNVESHNNESLMNEKTRELVDRINNLD